MRRMIVIALCLWMTASVAAQSQAEIGVLQEVKKMMKESGGQVTFSALVNNDRFSPEQKKFLARLYEIFFQIPSVLKSEYESTGEVPSRQDLAANFGITASSVDLLLAVMKRDPRVPSMFSLDASGEITSLNIDNINGFLQQRGAAVKVSSWEGELLPDFKLTTLDGKPISSSDLRGSGSLVYFWFTGCPPCGRISPHLAKLDEMYGDKGFRILGVNADEVLGITADDKQRRDYLAKHDVQFVNAHLNESAREAFGGIQIFPTLFFADSSGNIVAHFINYQDFEVLESAARKVATGVN